MISAEARAGFAESELGPLPVGQDLSGPVDVVVRPEHLALDRGEQAEVELIEFYGHDAMVFVRVLDTGRRVPVRTGPLVEVGRGDRVGLRFVPDRAVAFPASIRT